MIRKLYSKYRSLFWTLERQAKYEGVVIGKNNYIASHFWGREPYLIKIGSFCQITQGVKIFTHGGGAVLRHKYPDFDCFGRVTIGNFVYLGNNVLIMPGVEIGDNVLVAGGSVVTKSIPSGSVVGGNPARYICSIDDYERNNLKYNTHSKNMSPQEKKKILLSMDESLFIKKRFLI